MDNQNTNNEQLLGNQHDPNQYPAAYDMGYNPQPNYSPANEYQVPPPSGPYPQYDQHNAPPGGNYPPPGGNYAPPAFNQNPNYMPSQPDYPPTNYPVDGYAQPNYGAGLPVNPNMGHHVHMTEEEFTYAQANPTHSGSGEVRREEPKSRAPIATQAMFQGITYSVYCTCPSCHKATNTRVVTRVGTIAWVLCIIMFLFGFWICCFIPFCIDGMQDGNHYCTNCGSAIGRIGS
jgi:hypothetical protein